MTHETPRDPLRHALRTLPRARPDADFTQRVLERARPRTSGQPRRAGRLRLPAAARWAAAASLAVATLAAGLALPRVGERAAERERRARIEALDAERVRLRAELDEIRRLATSLREPAPVLYLGGDEKVDLVLDLDRLMRERPAEAGATPATYRGRRLD